MSTTALLDGLRVRGVELTAEGPNIRIRAPRGILTPDDRAVIGAAKTELLAELEAEANGWRRNPDGPGWVEAPERASRCAFNDGPLTEGNPILCAACFARILGEYGDEP